MERRVKKFYDNHELIHAPSSRMLRIMSEYFGPQEIFRKKYIKDTVVFFGSARIRPRHMVAQQIEQATDPQKVKGLEKILKASDYYDSARELAYKLTKWSKGLKGRKRRFIVATGGGPGIMEAANRGAAEAKGLSVGLNIELPHEEQGNPYISQELEMEFHYFFMRKYWFVYLAKALIAFPGGFGTLDELFETLTLTQTGKLSKAMPIVLFGKRFWDEVISLQTLVDYGTISPEDIELCYQTDDVNAAFKYLTGRLTELYLEK